MTLQELYSISYLDKEIEDYNSMILQLREQAEKTGALLTGMPRSGGVSDKVGECATAIAFYIDLLEKAVAEKIKQQMLINQFILEVEDAELRRIMYLRFIKRKTWRDVAADIGGNNTEDGVRKRCSRYVNTHAGSSDMSA